MARIPFGLESDAPGSYQTSPTKHDRKLAEAIRDDNNIYDTFRQALVTSNTDQSGEAYTGTAAQAIGFSSGKAHYEYYVAAAATPSIVAPHQSASGLEVKPIAAADACEITNGTTSLSRAAYTVGSFLENKKIFFSAKILVDDISDVTEFFMGWRKAEAYRADPDDYDEMASFNVGKDADGQVEIHTILNNASTAEVDTTLTDWLDAGEHTLRIEVDNLGRCVFFYDGAEPTVTTGFKFDSGEVILPFFHLNSETGDPGVSISEWKVGYM